MFIDGLGSGGAQRQFSHLARGLAGRGHQVTVAVYNDQDHFAGEILKAGVSIVRLPKPSRVSPRPIFALGRLYRRCSAQVAIAFLRSPAAKAELARLMFPEMKVIAAERTVYPRSPLPLVLRLTQSLHHLARFITVNSYSQSRAMKREFPGLATRITTIRNGIDMPKAAARPAPADRGELRLVAVSSLMPYKNSVRLAEALAVLRDEQHLRVTLTWVGETFEHMPQYGTYHQTCERIRVLGLEDQWRWLGVRQDVSRLLAEHDGLVHPSLFEGTSNAVCEAMALGVPVLAGNIADHEDMLRRTGAGLLFDPLDVRSIANAIAKFASLDASSRRDMGRRGRKLIEDHYGFDQMVTGYEILARAAAQGDKHLPCALLNDDARLPSCAE
jgi:glycosyltransferase involved in cell wall biosynthesis